MQAQTGLCWSQGEGGQVKQILGAPRDVVLVGRCLMLRQTLASYLSNVGKFRVLGEHTMPTELSPSTWDQPDFPTVILDVDNVDVADLAALRRWTQQPKRPGLVWIGSDLHDWRIRLALDLGVRGYVLKTDPVDELLVALHAIQTGGGHFSAPVRARMAGVRGGKRNRRERTRLELLSPRELQVLQRIACGGAKRGIAEEMGISIKTVETLTARLMKKLDIHDRVGLARFAIREGLSDP